MGAPAARGLTQAPGAGHGEAGDAPLQGPAQEEVSPAQPRPAYAETERDAAPVIELARVAKAETAETGTGANGALVMTRPKPEKRKNAKDRAKAKFAKDDAKTAEDGTTPMTAKAKSEAAAKAQRKAAGKVAAKVAAKAAKAERRAKRTAAKDAA